MAHRLRMSPLLRIILLLSLALPFLPAESMRAQEGSTGWQPLGSPAGRLTQLAASQNGKDLYAVSAVTVNRQNDETQWREVGVPTQSNALYASRDGGATWAAVTNDLPPGLITALYVDHLDQVWVGLQMRGDLPGRRNGLWTSADRGLTWREQGLERSDLVIRSVTENADKQLVFGAVGAGGSDSGVVYVRAGDGQWSRHDVPGASGEAGARLTSLVAHPTNARVLFVVTETGNLLRSEDRGESWAEAKGVDTASSGSAQLTFLASQPSTAILVRTTGSSTRALQSTDDGASWSEVRASGFASTPLVVRSMLALRRGVLLVNTDGGTYRSADGGMRWQPLEGALSSGFVHAWAAPSEATVLAATDYGLFISMDAGAVWRAYGAGLPSNSGVRAVLTQKDRPGLLAAALRGPDDADPPELLLTRDGGRTWLPADGGGAWDAAAAWAVDPNNADNLFAAGANFVAASRDGGFSWKVRQAADSLRTAIAVAPSDPSHVYVDGAPQLRSTDGGLSWSELPAATRDGATEARTGLAIDPVDASHLWSSTAGGVVESRDGGTSWQPAGLDGKAVRWLAATGGGKDQGPLALFAGLADGGLMRRRAGGDWQPADAGIPDDSVVVAFATDARVPGLMWAARDGGGVYRSTDGGDNWANVAVGMGDNLVTALAVNYQAPGAVFAGTASAGVWSLGGTTQSSAASSRPPAAAPTTAPTDASGRTGVDARIEVVWPHGFAAIDQAQQANVGIRLFVPRSLQLPACGWRPKVQLWRAVGSEPAEPVETADQRTVDGQPFPYWDANDVDVSAARDPNGKVYFLVTVDGVDTASSVWAHAADARTYFPEQEVPSGVASGTVDAVDARIQIVWPHDRQGNEAGVDQADLANVAVTLFKHGTRLSVPASWSGQVTLYGAWNSEVARAFAIPPSVGSRQAGVITYPVWEFNDVSVDRARDGGNRLYLWAVARGVKSYPTIWAHGADSRTFFPAKDEPIQGCLP